MKSENDYAREAVAAARTAAETYFDAIDARLLGRKDAVAAKARAELPALRAEMERSLSELDRRAELHARGHLTLGTVVKDARRVALELDRATEDIFERLAAEEN